ncbi:MAG: sodium:solute symporter [Candidatus Sumerlaea chitinivorans]|nr:sodium:solute symporter [Candidatus Sumerlaea chitinivorans]
MTESIGSVGVSWGLLVDGLIILLYFVLITTIGLYMGRRERSLHDYALGGRQMPWWAVMASIIAAETSAATFLTVPAEGFKERGIVYTQLCFGLILGRVLVGMVFLKPYYDYRVYTVYDFLAVRFGPKTKNYVSMLFLIFRTLAMGVRVYVPALVMVLAWRMIVHQEQIRDLATGDSWVPYGVAIFVLVAITTAYTFLGGIKAVIWTDLIQATLMFFSAIVAIFSILSHLGKGSIVAGLATLGNLVPEMTSLQGYIRFGWEGISAEPGIGEAVTAFAKKVLADPYTLFSALIGYTIFNMAMFGTDQDMVQRLLTAKDYRRSRRSLLTAALMDLPIFAAFSFIGVLLLAFYQIEPLLKPTKVNDIFGAYIMNVMPVVVRGFVLAGLFATAMGSLSAALNALATSATNDWYLHYLGRKVSERHQITAARIFTILFALLMVIIATFTAYNNVVNPDSRLIPIALGVAGLFAGPMLGVFLVGMLTKTRGSDEGNMIALSVGLVATLVLCGQVVEVLNLLWPRTPAWQMPAWWPKIAFTWYALIGALITFAVAVLFPTPQPVLAEAARRRQQAELEGDKPLALRS